MEDAGSVFLRRTEISDAPGIALLLDDPNTFGNKVFGDANVVSTIEKAILGITAVDSRGHIVGHASFSDAPLIKGVHPRSWHMWLDDEFDNDAIKPINSISLSLFVVVPDRAEVITTEILRTLFVAGTTIENCLLVLPASVDITHSAFIPHFTAVPRKKNPAKPGQQLFVCNHRELNPKLYVRIAEPEDFDDLTPVFNQQSEVLQSQYGADEFFMAELIEAQSTTQKCLAAVVNGRAVALMCLTTDGDTNVLQQCFECGPYDNLDDNVFTIAMFCITPDYASRSLDMMAAAFDHFVDKTYCVITMPHDVAEIPLLQHFTKVSSKTGSNLPHEMWIMHKHGLLIDITVRPFEEDDREGIVALTNNIEGNELISADLDRVATSGVDPDGTMVGAYVAMSCDKIVGVVVCRSAQEDAAQLRAHYNIEEYILYLQHRTFEQGHLNHFILNPIFERHSKLVLREAMRLAGMSCIYHRIYTQDDDATRPMPYTVPTMLDSMIPVRHRRQIDYPNNVLKSNVPSLRVRHCDPPFALTFLNRKLMLESKIAINLRIVVVGNSDTALSFLESMFMKPHLRFTNLTLIDPGGLPGDLHNGQPNFLSTTHAWSGATRKRVSWGTWVNIVDDKLITIDRDERMVQLASGAVVAYDYLVLAPDLKYDVATAASAKGAVAPLHVDVINSFADAQLYRTWIRGTFMGLSGQMIVYGGGVDAFAAVDSLLKLGVPPSRITQIMATHTPEGFGNTQAATLVLETTRGVGVEVVCGQTLVEWGRLSENDDQLGFARFRVTENTNNNDNNDNNNNDNNNNNNNNDITNNNNTTTTTTNNNNINNNNNNTTTTGNKAEPPLVRECDGFLCFHTKSVDLNYFHAVNDCHLVFDGRLVIDNQFCTNDDFIFAAGPFTKFSRKYHAKYGQPEAYNDCETGVCLANVVLAKIDPIAVATAVLGDTELVRMTQPKIVGATFAGGLQYLHVKAPVVREVGRDNSRHLVTPVPVPHSVGDSETSPTTSPPSPSQPSRTTTTAATTTTATPTATAAAPYFSLTIGETARVTELCCVGIVGVAGGGGGGGGGDGFSVSNLLCLYDKHEKILNKVVSRYDEGLVDDFFIYFNQAWVMAVYHDRFPEYMSEITDRVSSHASVDVNALEELAMKLGALRHNNNDDNDFREEEDAALLAKSVECIAGDTVADVVKTRLMDFLTYNAYHLPMYARPTTW